MLFRSEEFYPQISQSSADWGGSDVGEGWGWVWFVGRRARFGMSGFVLRCIASTCFLRKICDTLRNLRITFPPRRRRWWRAADVAVERRRNPSASVASVTSVDNPTQYGKLHMSFPPERFINPQMSPMSQIGEDFL